MPKDYCLVLFTTFDLAYRIGGLVEQSVEQNKKQVVDTSLFMLGQQFTAVFRDWLH